MEKKKIDVHIRYVLTFMVTVANMTVPTAMPEMLSKWVVGIIVETLNTLILLWLIQIAYEMF